MKTRPDKLTEQQQINQLNDEIDLLETLSWDWHLKGDNLKAAILERITDRLYLKLDSFKHHAGEPGLGKEGI